MSDRPRTYSVDGQEIELAGAPLDSEQFQHELDEMVREVRNGGWLFVLRNKLPFALIAEAALHHGGVQLHFSEDQVATYVRGLQERGRELYEQHARVCVIVPANAGKYFQMGKAPLLPRAITPSGGKPDQGSLKDVWDDFFTRWSATGALRAFDPERPGEHRENLRAMIVDLEKLVLESLELEEGDHFVNFLPDLWLCIARPFFRGREPSRDDAEAFLVDIARNLAQTGRFAAQSLQTQLDERKLILVQLSGNEINPRFRGLRIVEEQFAAPLIVHSALVYGRSTRCR